MRGEIEEAMQLIRKKEAGAMDRALELLQGAVFAFSMKVCGQREDAEDTMQEVLLKTAAYLPKFESSRALSVWLYQVAKNRCLMSRRRSKYAAKGELSLDELMPDRRELKRLGGQEGETPESRLQRQEDAEGLRRAVKKLPLDYRLILILHDMEELSGGELAEITGLRPGSIRVRLHRARLFVRKELAKQREGGGKGKRSGAKKEPEPPGGRRCQMLFAELSNYLDEELDESLCEEMEKHLSGCEACRAFLKSLEETIWRCRNAPAEAPDPARAAKLRGQLLAKYREAMGTRQKTARRAAV